MLALVLIAVRLNHRRKIRIDATCLVVDKLSTIVSIDLAAPPSIRQDLQRSDKTN